MIRNKIYEIYVILASFVEWFLMNHQTELHAFIPGARRNASNELIFGGGRWKLKFNQPLTLSFPTTITPAIPFNIFHGNQFIVRESQWMCERTINNTALHGAFFNLHLCGFADRINDLINTGLSFDERDIQKSKEIATLVGISSAGWNSSVPDGSIFFQTPPQSNWIPEYNSEVFAVRDINGIIQYQLQFFYPDSSSYYVLPLAFYKSPHFTTPVRLFIPPQERFYAWMNTELLVTYPQAEVYLTEDMLFAKNYLHTPQAICLGNPSGNQWVDKIPIHFLTGRKITIMHDNSNESYGSALVLSDRISNSLGITPQFINTGENDYVYPY